MIYLYSGTPGSGKSLHQAYDIYYLLKRGKPVIANYPIDTEPIHGCKGQFTYVDNDSLTPEFLQSYASEFWGDSHPKEGAIRLYIDEAQILFNARSWNAQGRSEWIKFFTHHRKYGYDIYLVAQFDRMLDRQIRYLIEYNIDHRKLNNFGLFGFIAGKLCGGAAFCAVKSWYQQNERISSQWFLPRRKYTRIYDTYKLFDEKPTTAQQ